jgi:hypothetical protein
VRYENDVTAEGLQESLTLVGKSSAGRPALPASGFGLQASSIPGGYSSI